MYCLCDLLEHWYDWIVHDLSSDDAWSCIPKSSIWDKARRLSPQVGKARIDERRRMIGRRLGTLLHHGWMPLLNRWSTNKAKTKVAPRHSSILDLVESAVEVHIGLISMLESDNKLWRKCSTSRLLLEQNRKHINRLLGQARQIIRQNLEVDGRDFIEYRMELTSECRVSPIGEGRKYVFRLSCEVEKRSSHVSNADFSLA